MKRIDNTILKILLIVVPLFIVLYCIYPFFVSIEQANRYNIERFSRKKEFLQKIINLCIEDYGNNYLDQQVKTITFNELPVEIQKQLTNEGISEFHATITHETGEVNIIASFYTERYWCNRILNNVTIRYSSYSRFDVCPENNLKAYMNEICLRDGWFFDVDTDWL
jgi:hypothetical protein